MKRIRYSLLIVVLLASLQGYGQKFSSTLLYQVGVPAGNTSDFIGKVSARGITGSYRMYFSDYVSVGLAAGWQVFTEKLSPRSITDGNLTLYGTQFRYINAIPVYLSPQVHLPGNTLLKPYVGLGIGTTYFSRETQLGLYSFGAKQWLFGLYPEAGVLIPLNESLHINVAGRYNQLFKGGDVTNPQGYAGISIGITKIIER